MNVKTRSSVYLALFVSLGSCKGVTIPNTTACTAAGRLRYGAVCAESLTDTTSDMSYEAFLAFLEPRPATRTTPGRAGAICQSAIDYTAQKTALEQLCVLAKKRCTKQAKEAIEAMRRQIQALSAP